jgi:histidyl-tRNA synthetase
MLIELSSVRGSVGDVTSRTNVRDLSAWQNLEALVGSLASRKVENVRVNFGIVRGLDYYSGIVFEAFDESDKGAALVGGGRYDRLTEAFGRKDLGATGVAGGVERIVLALRRKGVLGLQKTPLVYIACTGDELRQKMMEIVTGLRGAGFAVEYDLVGKQLRKQLDDASGRQAAAAVIIAPEELKENKVIVKSMQSGAEEKHPVSGLKRALDDLLRS